MAKIQKSGSVVLGISIDSPFANAAFAKQIGVTFPLLSDMNRSVLEKYGIVSGFDLGGGKVEFARRTSFVIDKKGVIQHIDFDSSAIDPNNAVEMCVGLQSKDGK